MNKITKKGDKCGMAKTGQKAQFKMGESTAGSVLLPTKFVTASAANKKGQRFSNLVETYASKANKINEENNATVADNLVTESQSESQNNEAYATRGDAVTDGHPLFNSETLNMNDDQVAKLKADLDTAQDNGNVLHEMAFSLRGDWLVENKLYNPKTHEIDQDKLKHAEQGVVKKLFDQGFPLPLGEGKDDVVWFGVIHQDTDHLNMHLWFAKKSEETRPEMLHASGEPKGVINFKVKKAVEAQFRNELEDIGIKQTRAELFGRVDMLRKDIKSGSLTQLKQASRYRADLKDIYNVLPQDLLGRWKVGNTDVANTKPNSRMALANSKMNALVDQLLKADLKEEYREFRKDAKAVDAMMEKAHGHQNQGQELWSDTRDKRLRKEIANAIYREFNTGYNPNLSEQNQKVDEKTKTVDNSSPDAPEFQGKNRDQLKQNSERSPKNENRHNNESNSTNPNKVKMLDEEKHHYLERLNENSKSYRQNVDKKNSDLLKQITRNQKSSNDRRTTSTTKNKKYNPSPTIQLRKITRRVVRENIKDVQATRAFLREKELEERQESSDDLSASI